MSETKIKPHEAVDEIRNMRVHFAQLTDDQRERFGVYVADGQEPHMAVMRTLAVLDALDAGTGGVATYVHGYKPEPTPRDSREAVIEKKLTEILLGMDHATGDRDLQIWIATEGINEALALLREKGE